LTTPTARQYVAALIAMNWQRLSVTYDGPILRVWLDRPAKRNALDGTALEEIAQLFDGLATDFVTRVVVLGGRGPSFCAGADRSSPPGAERLAASSDASERERRWTAQIGRRAARAIEDAEVVTIARLHGHVVGGGVVLAAACDFRVASEDAIFHVPEVDLGIPLTWGGTPRLIHELGAARARELVLLCDRIDAAEAHRIGLVHRVVPAAELDAKVNALATRLAAKPEAAVHMTKTQFRAYAARAAQGDVRETDGDQLVAASRSAIARLSFPTK
jgi:enoyl-CoA hydratase/carnithine racemase